MALLNHVRRRSFLTWSLVAPVLVAACGNPLAPKPVEPAASPTLLRLPEGAQIVNTMDPGISSGGEGLEQMQNLFEGLVVIDQTNGQLKPGQAERWAISPDGLVYTFTLRPGLKWSDGQLLSAADFEWTWRRNVDPATKSRYGQVLYPIKGAEAFATGKGSAAGMMVKAADERTLVVTLERLAPFFLHLMATWTAYPLRRDMIEQHGDSWTAAARTYISNGHYRLVEWKPGQQMIVEKNPHYWGENAGPDRIVWSLYNDPISKGLIAYEADELDHAQIGGTDILRAIGHATLSKEIKKWERQGSQWIVMDTTNAPLTNVKVRQALSLAIDKKKLNEVVLNDAFFTAVSIVAPGVPGQRADHALSGDLTRAKQLLAEAGFPAGQGWPANVKFTFSSTSAQVKLIAEAVQGMWKDNLGIEIVLDPLSSSVFDEWRRSRKNQPFHFYVNGWGSDYEDPNNWYNVIFHSRIDFFYTHWKHADFDRLVDQGLAEHDQSKRVVLYEQADRILNEEAPFIPIYHWARYTVTKPHVTGLVRYRVLGRVQGHLVRLR